MYYAISLVILSKFNTIQKYHYIIKKTLLELNLKWAISMILVNRIDSLPYLMVMTNTEDEMATIKSTLYLKYNISIEYNTISILECTNNDDSGEQKQCNKMWETRSELYEMDIYELFKTLFMKCIGIPLFYGEADKDDNLEKIYENVFRATPDGMCNYTNTSIVNYNPV
jgi:hypothetical protein